MTTSSSAASRNHLGRDLLVGPARQSHIVQFYEDEGFLADVVADFLAAGLQAEEPLLVIATAAHRAAFVARLEAKGFHVERAIDQRRLVLLDAKEALARVMRGGMPDWFRFEQTIGGTLSALCPDKPRRAYGEMVDLLWQEGERRAAIQLEDYWNELGRFHSLSLLCAYGMSNFGDDADRDGFQHVCDAHSHVLPAEHYAELPDQNARLREVSLLQQRAQALEGEIERRKRTESALVEALRTRDDFMAAASHELRTPLTALQLYMQGLGALTRQGHPQLQSRVNHARRQIKRLSSLVGQLLDVSQDTASPLPLNKERFDLALLARMVAEQAADAALHAGSRVQVLSEEPLHGDWDRSRIERMLTNLLANAIEYGDGKPIELLMKLTQDRVQLRVRDHGAGIAESDQARIFERFERAADSRHSSGLGLGLWISQRIAEAHGGSIRVDSQPGNGATFTVELPL